MPERGKIAPPESSLEEASADRRRKIASLIAEAPQAADAAAVPARAAGRWRHLSAAEAARHRLHGIRGGLLALALLLFLECLRASVEAVDFWATTDHGGLSAWSMAVLRSMMTLWVAVILGLMIGLNRAFPANFTAYSIVNIVYQLLFGLAFAHLTSNAVFIGVGAEIGVMLVAMAYVAYAPRVDVTYRRRVRDRRPHGDAAPGSA